LHLEKNIYARHMKMRIKIPAVMMMMMRHMKRVAKEGGTEGVTMHTKGGMLANKDRIQRKMLQSL
jgi:hypothetical protein